MFVKTDKLEISWKSIEVSGSQRNPIVDKIGRLLDEEKHGEEHSIVSSRSIEKEMKI